MVNRGRTINKPVAGPVTLLFILVLCCSVALAGDEDMLSPYAEFDPETGFFLRPDGQIAGSGAQGMQPRDTSPGTAVTTSNTDTPTGQGSSSDNASGLSVLVVPGIIAVLVTGFIYGLRRHRRDTG